MLIFNRKKFNTGKFNSSSDGTKIIKGSFESITETESFFDGEIIEGAVFTSITETDAYFKPIVHIFGAFESVTETGATVEPVILITGEFESITETESYFDGQIIIPGEFESITTTDSYFEGRIRTYTYDPKKYEKSEPIFIYDRNENLQLILSDDSIPHFDSWITERINDLFNLETTVLANNPDVALIENEGRAVTRNADGNFAEFIIRIVNDIETDNGTFKLITAENGAYELNDEFLPEYRQASVNLRTALTAILQGTRFEAGEIEGYEQHSIDIRNKSVKYAVNELLRIYNKEIRYRVEIEGNQVTKRYIDMFSKRGENLGKRFEAGKDIISTERNLDSMTIKTALYGRGASDENGNRLDFTQVEWRKEWGDPVDKPLGQGWVGDPGALEIWGYENGNRHRTGYYDGQEEDAAELLLNTWNQLQELIKLRDTYDFKVLQLAEILDMEHERVRLGDSALAINRRIHPYVEQQASIIEYRHNLNDKKLSEVTLGHFRNEFQVGERLHNIEKDYNDKRGEFLKKPEAEAEKAKSEIGQWVDQKIEDTKEELEQAMENIEQTKIDLEDAENLIQDTIDNPQNYSGDFVGDLIADSLIVRGPIVSQNATITGTIQSSNATFINATMQTGNIINANIQDATITGDLVSGRIFSQGTTFVGTDLTVTNNLYLGSTISSGTKQIVFNNNARISGGGSVPDTTLSLHADIVRLSGQLWLDRAADTTGYGTLLNYDLNDNRRLKLSVHRNYNINQSTAFWIDPRAGQGGNWYFRKDNQNIHVLYYDGTKDGGSIEIDDNRYGMSPIDSPQTLIYDLITDINVNGLTTIYLDELYVKAIADYAVFASNPNVAITEKHEDYFVVDGIGLVDFQVIGTRKGYEGTYFTDMTKMSEDMMPIEGA